MNIIQFQQRTIIKNPFEASLLNERQEKSSNYIDSKEIFQKIDKEHKEMSYTQAVEYYTELANVVIPFDKTLDSFNILLSRLKLLLKN